LPIKATWGGIAGLFLVREVSPGLAVQLEALYSQRGVKDDVDSADATARLTYIDVPLTARWSSTATGPMRFHLFTGPQVGIKVKAEVINDQLDMTSSISDQIRAWDFGWTAGAGISRNRVSLDARYTVGLTDISAVDEGDGSAKNRTFTLLVGVQFR
jgi:opacity protein-like surface antigen